MGPRLPAGIPRAYGAARALARGAAHRAHRDRRRADAPGDRRAACARRRAPVRRRASTVPTSATPSSRSDDARAPAAGFLRDEHRGEAGIVYCLSRAKVEETAAVAGRAGLERPALPRRHGRRDARRATSALPARRRHRDGRDDRLRHGHRQARRALRRASRPAEEHRGLLPGNRPRRPRRRAGRRMDGLRPGRRGAAAADDRAVRGRRGRSSACSWASSMRCSAFAKPPAAGACGCSTISARREAAHLRQLRQLPGAAADLGRHRGRAQGAVVRLPHRPALRRRAPDRRAARRETERVSAMGPRQAEHVRHRRRLDDTAWRSVFRQLVVAGYARPDHEAYGALQLTEASRPVLKGEQRVAMRTRRPRTRQSSAKATTAAVPADVAMSGADAGAARPAQGLARGAGARTVGAGLRDLSRQHACRHRRRAAAESPRRSPASAASARASWNATARRCWNCCGNKCIL